MKKKKLLSFAALVVFCLSLSSPAFAGNFFAGAGVGTLGGGVDLGYQFNEVFKVRINANYLPFDYSKKYSGIKYDAELRNFTAGLLLDVHPFQGKFRISVGAYYRDLDVDLDATPHKKVKIGNNEYSPSEVGKLKGEATWDKFAPYLGLGWGMGGGTESNFSFDFNLGAMYMSGVDVKYKASSPLGGPGDPAYDKLMADVDREAKKIKNDIDDWKVYPVLSVFFSWRF